MACFRPLKGYKSPSGKGITFKRSESTGQIMSVPCGQCIGCRCARTQQWAIRLIHESQMHEQNTFVTLTYNDANLPADRSVNKRHWQLFMKKLRRSLQPKKLRFYQAGEYGSPTKENNFIARPHYHALIFGHQFPDLTYWKEVRGNIYYTSKILTDIWEKGFCVIGAVSPQSAAYTARYVIKKINGPSRDQVDEKTGLKPYEWLTAEGELRTTLPEHSYMSRKPGIGFDFYKKYKSDIFPGDFCILDGKKKPTPDYYMALLQKDDPDLYQTIKETRIATMQTQAENNTDTRLQAREICALARADKLLRKLE